MQEDEVLVGSMARQSLEEALKPSYHFAASAISRLAFRPELRWPIADVALSGLMSLADDCECDETRNDAARALAQLMCDDELREEIMAAATPGQAEMLQDIYELPQAFWSESQGDSG